MSRDNPWTKHRQSFWQEKCGNPSLPLWIRVYSLAYGNHRRNGHTPYDRGEVALGTQIVDSSTAEIKTPGAAEISRAIAKAIEYGFLHGSSNARCLVVPPWGIEGGLIGRVNDTCALHNRQRKPQDVDSIGKASLPNLQSHIALTSDNVVSLYDSSLPHPTAVVDHG